MLKTKAEAKLLNTVSSDKELANMIAKGRRVAEDALCRKYRPRLIRYLGSRRLQHYDKEDIAQESLAIALVRLRIGLLDNPDRLSSYLFGIANKLVFREYRKERRRQTQLDQAAVENATCDNPSPFEDYDTQQTRNQILYSISLLGTERDRIVLHSLYILDRDRAKVASELGVSKEQLSRILHRAKNRMRDIVVSSTGSLNF